MHGRTLRLAIGTLVVLGVIWLMPWPTLSSGAVDEPKVDLSEDRLDQTGTNEQPEQDISRDQPEVAPEDTPAPEEERALSNPLPPSSPADQPASPPPAQASLPSPPPPPPPARASLPSSPPPPPPREEIPNESLFPNDYRGYDDYWDYNWDYNHWDYDNRDYESDYGDYELGYSDYGSGDWDFWPDY
jgi:hypothetical protein